MGRSNFILPMSALPPSWHSSVPGENALAHNFSPEGKEKSGACIQNSGFLEGCPRYWFLSHLTQSADGTGIIWIPVDHENEEKQRAGMALCTQEKEHNLRLLPWVGEECVLYSSSSECCLRDWLLPSFIWSTDRTSIGWIPGGHWGQRRVGAACCSQYSLMGRGGGEPA